jgi:hypothetical protein
MHNTYACLIKWSATCSLAGVHVGRPKRGSFVHTWILCGTCVVTHTADDSQTRFRGLFSPTRNGLGSEEHVPVWRNVSTLAWRIWGINDVGNASGASTTRRLEWSESQRNLVSNTSLRVSNLRWRSIGWSPIKSMTQLNRSPRWGN